MGDFSLLTIVMYTTFVLHLTMLSLCYKETEEHGEFILLGVVRLFLFGLTLAAARVSEANSALLSLLQHHALMAISVLITNYCYRRWMVPGRRWKGAVLLSLYGIVWVGMFFDHNPQGPFHLLSQGIIGFANINCGYLFFRYSYGNPFLTSLMERLLRRLLAGILLLFPLALLFDPFYRDIQFLRSFYTFEFPVRIFFNLWLNIMTAYMAFRTMVSMPHIGKNAQPLRRLVHLGMTPRESDVLPLLLSGKSNGEIAQELDIAVSTVKTHVRNIYKKVGVTTRHELISYAVKGGELPPKA